jgi:NCS1 family nucleobase:cation symporter-1
VLVISGTVLVFSVIGLTWVHSSSDLARYQRPGSSGAASMLWATFGATLPPFLLISWGAMLAASSDELAEGLATQPLVTLASLLPAWYPLPLLLAAGLSLVSGAVLAMYSGGFALQAVGLRVPRALAVLVAALLVTAVAGVLLYLGTDARELMRDVVTTIAVPIAAWAGIFAAEMMIRSRRFHAPSLLTRGGVYPDFRWVNFIGLFAVSVVGFGLTSATLSGLDWQGFLFPAFGIAADDPLATSDVGVLVALLLGLVIPLVSAIPEIRRQEDVKPPEV